MENEYKPVGYYLSKLMRESNITKTDLSKILKVNPSTVTRLISGEIGLNSMMALYLEEFSGKRALTWMNYQIKFEIQELRKKQGFEETKLTKKRRKRNKDNDLYEEW